MADETKPRAIVQGRRVGAESKKAARAFAPQKKRVRTREQLKDIVDQVAANEPLIDLIRSSLGSGNAALGFQVMEEVAKFAQSVDPTINNSEGTRIVVAILQRLGHFKD